MIAISPNVHLGLIVTHGACKIKITATGDFGFDSGRARYRVECLTCKALLHENTTSPEWQIRTHINELDKAWQC